jgi:hypothetical protein
MRQLKIISCTILSIALSAVLIYLMIKNSGLILTYFGIGIVIIGTIWAMVEVFLFFYKIWEEIFSPHNNHDYE